MPSSASSVNSSRLTALEKRASFSLSGIFALRMLGLFLILPVFAVYAKSLPGGSDPFLVGLTLGIYGLTQGILQIPYGLASDRWGRKPVIVVGLIVFAIGSALAAMGNTIVVVLVGRALQGAGAVSAAVTAMISDSVRFSVLTRAMALIGASIGLTFAFSLIVGPILTECVGVSGLFWLTGALALGAVFVMIFVVPTPKNALSDKSGEHTPWPRIVFNPQLVLLNLGIFSLHIVQMALFVVVPLQLTALQLPLPHHWQVYLPAVGISFIFLMPLLTKAERAGKMKTLFITSISLIACVYLGLLVLDRSLIGIAVMLTAFFTGFNILEASLPSLVSKTAPPTDKGLALGVYNTTQSLGLFVGGAVGGWLSSRYGSNGVYLFSALLMLLWLAASVKMKIPEHQRGREIDLNS